MWHWNIVLVNRHYRKVSDDRMIVNLLRIAGAVIILYLVLKIIDLSVRGAWGEVFSGGMEGNMFLLETIVGFVVPAVIIFSPWIKKRQYAVDCCTLRRCRNTAEPF